MRLEKLQLWHKSVTAEVMALYEDELEGHIGGEALPMWLYKSF